MKKIAFMILIVIYSALALAKDFSQDDLQALLQERFEKAKFNGNVVSFVLNGRPLYCVSDAAANRMRIVAPIVKWDEVSAEQKDFMLIANFHRALDARYAASDGVVYAAFIHPLSSMNEELLDSALRQVNNLAQSFGSSYTSGEMHFSEPPVDPQTPATEL